jgi:hypothetical protein
MAESTYSSSWRGRRTTQSSSSALSNLAHHARNVWHIACRSQIAAFFRAFLLPGSAAYRRFTMRNFATTKQSICLLVTVLAFAVEPFATKNAVILKPANSIAARSQLRQWKGCHSQ